MGIHKRPNGKYQVTLEDRYVKVVDTKRMATDLLGAGRLERQKGIALDRVVAHLRGEVEQAHHLTLDEYFERWAGSLTTPPETTYRYRVNYRRVSEHIGHIPVTDLGPEHVRKAVGAMSATYAPKTVSVSVAVLRSLLLSAIDDGLIERSPADRIRNMPKAASKRLPRVITRANYRALIEAAPTHRQPLIGLWPLVGLRLGEMRGLRWEDVHDDFIAIRRQWDGKRYREPKTVNGIREVDLTPSAQTWLERQRDMTGSMTDVVFPTERGTPVSASVLYRDWLQPICEDAGVEVRPHDLRHTFGSWLIASGAPITYVQERMGHASPEITLKHYIQELKERDRTAALNLHTWLDGGKTET